jgi:hypothetical protein
MPRALVKRRTVVLALATGLSFCIAGSMIAAAAPTLTQEEQQGEAIAEAVRAGERQCADLSADEFDLIGEYAMGSFLGSGATHSAMNRRMTLMMGEPGERRMHMALGYRYSGCPGGPVAGWVGTVAGMMGGGGTGGSEPGTLGIALIALAAAAVGAGLVALLMQRQQTRKDAEPSAP